jgi:CubicO group peptidase (beta-lactamase class C family)
MLRYIAVIVTLLSSSVSWADTPKTSPPEKFDPATIDAFVAKRVAEKEFVGLSFAVVRDGQLVLAKGYGRVATNGPAVTPDTAFAIGSVTKQFACACIFLLAEDGKLSVRDPVSKYYPGLTRAADITLYDLMTHTSGYPDYYPLDFVDRRMKKSIVEDDLIREYAGGKLDFEPRSRWSYSNTGYTILGRVVEKVSGESFERFLKRRILVPLQLNHTVFDPKARTSGLATGHTSVLLGPPEVLAPEGSGWTNAAGAIYAPAADLARWDIGLMTGRVLKPESLRLMMKPSELSNGKVADYGCGLAITRQEGETVLAHGGAVAGFLAVNIFVPRTKSAVIALSNSEHADPGELAREIVGLLLKDDARREEIVPKIAGLSTQDAAASLFRQLQDGAVDRTQLGEEFDHWLSEERVKAAAPRLKALGEPTKVEVERTRERGGMEASRIRFSFKDATIEANMFRSTDGKIQQFLIMKE